jgi:hypothetical protein
VFRDDIFEVIWVVNMLRYQGSGGKIKQAVEHQLKTLHDCPLVDVFVKYYKHLGLKYTPQNHAPCDTLSDALSDTRAPDIGTGTGTDIGTEEDLLPDGRSVKQQAEETVSACCDLAPQDLPERHDLVSPEPAWPSPEALYALYDATVPSEQPRWEIFDDNRRRRLAQYLKLYPDKQFWVRVFEEVSCSPFLRGQVASKDRAPKKRGLDWLLSKGHDNRENCVKTYEGEYREMFVAPVSPSTGFRHKSEVMQEQQVQRYFSVVERTKAYEARERGEVLRETPGNERLLQGPDDGGASTPLLEGHARPMLH